LVFSIQVMCDCWTSLKRAFMTDFYLCSRDEKAKNLRVSFE